MFRAVDEQVLQADADDRVPMDDNENIHEGDFKKMNSQHERFFGSHAFGRESRLTQGTIKHRDVQELEMLLEAYFVQIDGTLNKLSTLHRNDENFLQDTHREGYAMEYDGRHETITNSETFDDERTDIAAQKEAFFKSQFTLGQLSQGFIIYARVFRDGSLYEV